MMRLFLIDNKKVCKPNQSLYPKCQLQMSSRQVCGGESWRTDRSYMYNLFSNSSLNTTVSASMLSVASSCVGPILNLLQILLGRRTNLYRNGVSEKNNEFMAGKWQGQKLKARVTLDNSEMYKKIETQPQPSSGSCTHYNG